MQKPKKEIKFYEELGSGAFGKVYRAYDPSLQRVVAVKMIEMDCSGDVQESLQELAILAELRCEHITRYYKSALYDSVSCVTMEFCAAGSCSNMSRRYTVFREDSAAYVLCGVLQGLEYVHSQNKIHRDLKSANISISHDCTVKIADFGVSAQLSRNTPQRDSFMGTPYWMAPEIIESVRYDTSVDIWSSGIVAFESITGMPPHRRSQPTDAMMLIVKEPPPQSPSMVHKQAISHDLVQLVGRCLSKDPSARPTATQLSNTKYMQNHRLIPASLKDMVGYMLRQRHEKYRHVVPRTLEDLEYLAPPKTKHSQPTPSEEGSNSDIEAQEDEDFELSFDMAAYNAQIVDIGAHRFQADNKESPNKADQNAAKDCKDMLASVQKAQRNPSNDGNNLVNIPRMSSKRRNGADKNTAHAARANPDDPSALRLMEQAFSTLEGRTKIPAANIRIKRLAKEMVAINSEYPGFTRAFLQEIWRAIIANETQHK